MDLKDIRFGIEIETVRQTREKVARAIQSVVGGTVLHTGMPQNQDPWEVTDARGRKWKVVADGSLTNVDAKYRAEIVSPILVYGDIPAIPHTEESHSAVPSEAFPIPFSESL